MPRRVDVAGDEVVVWSTVTFSWLSHPSGQEEEPVELLSKSRMSSGLTDVGGQAVRSNGHGSATLRVREKVLSPIDAPYILLSFW